MHLLNHSLTKVIFSYSVKICFTFHYCKIPFNNILIVILQPLRLVNSISNKLLSEF